MTKLEAIHIGDVVKCTDSRIGYVRWINKSGTTIGVELTEPKGDCDGTAENGKRKFLCRFNHGIFVERSWLKKVKAEDMLYKIAELNEIIRAFGRFHPKRLENVCKSYGIPMNDFWTDQSETSDSSENDGIFRKSTLNGPRGARSDNEFCQSRSRPIPADNERLGSSPIPTNLEMSKAEKEHREKKAAEIREMEREQMSKRRRHQRFNSDLARQGEEAAKQKYTAKSKGLKKFVISQKRKQKADSEESGSDTFVVT